MTGSTTGEWALYSCGAFMRCGPGENDKLARLADVRDWLMDRNEWPMELAADAVIAGLHKAHKSGLELFIADAKRYAQPLRPDTTMLGREELDACGGIRMVDDRLLGFAGVCNAILNGWIGEYRGYLSDAENRVNFVCVRAAVALELWGWGDVAAAGASVEDAAPPAAFEADEVHDFETLVRYRRQYTNLKPQERPKWPATHLAILRDAVRKHGRGGVAMAATSLSISASGVGELIRKHSSKTSCFPTPNEKRQA